jgi:hypothetical protein
VIQKGETLLEHRRNGVMVSVFSSSVVDRRFVPGSDLTKDYKIGSYYFSTKHAALKRNFDNFSE